MIARDQKFGGKGSLKRSKCQMNSGGLRFCLGEDGEMKNVEFHKFHLF